ncbi:MAG: twin-arginine translocation signal domain-containing protein, partial [Opitutaceae bacterium]|nr:twin-arginine translocation signal domain-containing protein [Opitutaceae bacterium]
MTPSHSSRRDFLKTSTLAGLSASLAGLALSGTQAAAQSAAASKNTGNLSEVLPRPAGQKPVHNLAAAPLARVRVGVIGLHRGMG